MTPTETKINPALTVGSAELSANFTARSMPSRLKARLMQPGADANLIWMDHQWPEQLVWWAVATQTYTPEDTVRLLVSLCSDLLATIPCDMPRERTEMEIIPTPHALFDAFQMILDWADGKEKDLSFDPIERRVGVYLSEAKETFDGPRFYNGLGRFLVEMAHAILAYIAAERRNIVQNQYRCADSAEGAVAQFLNCPHAIVWRNDRYIDVARDRQYVLAVRDTIHNMWHTAPRLMTITTIDGYEYAK